jgi:hypothetical protein
MDPEKAQSNYNTYIKTMVSLMPEDYFTGG